jgi:lipoprotein-anchoring transpeptidase ErfK/SrfK
VFNDKLTQRRPPKRPVSRRPTAPSAARRPPLPPRVTSVRPADAMPSQAQAASRLIAHPKGKARPHGLDVPLLILLGAPLAFVVLAVTILGLGALFLFGSSSSVLPGVSVGGVHVGGLSESDAAAALTTSWTERGIVLRDGSRVFPVDPALLGIELDAAASAETALNFGRSLADPGDMLRAAIGSIDLAPALRINTAVTEQTLRDLAAQIESAPTNAGVQLVNGGIEPRLAANGRALDIAGTVAPLEHSPADALADGELELAMIPIQPQLTDPAPLVAAASAFLATPLQVRAYNPVTDETHHWSVLPDTWIQWLTATPDSSRALGLALSLDAASLRGYLTAQQESLGTDDYIDLDTSAQAVQNAILRGQTSADVRIYQRDTTHVVQPGETIISIAYDYGIPYPYVQQANGGVDAVSIGQTITLPSHDVMLPEPIVFGKRIVVSISQQHAWVYEDGNLKWDWAASTGISSSPTWPGIYQIISHEENAYAANWDLWMPNFMGVYKPIPGSDFTNGFHGFPTRGGSQLLWTNSLGTRVTYGCILLSNDNIHLLYEWAENGVVVEIQP